MTMRDDACSILSIAKRLCRSPGTISREIKRAAGSGVYNANVAHIHCQARRLLPRRVSKLHVDGDLFQLVRNQLKLLWLSQRVSGV
jgi:IS30 family transposase